MPAVLVVAALALSSTSALDHSLERVADGTPVPRAEDDPAKARDVVLPSPFYQPLAEGEVRYPGATVRIHTRINADDQHAARIDASTAEKAYLATGVRSDLASRPRSVVLARFSDDTLGPVDAQGRPAPTHRDVLAWVITVPDAPVVLYHGNARTIAPGGGCDFVFVVNAIDGSSLAAFQACQRQQG